MRILDVGCWGGKKVKGLIEREYDAYGCDINTTRFIPEIKDRLFYLDITKPLPKTKPFDEKFDMICFEEVLEHLDEGKDLVALENLYKLLKKGGTLILTTPRSIPYFEWFDPAWVRWKLGFGQRHYHYSGEELFSKLNKVGLTYCKVRVNGNLWWLFTRWFNAITRTSFLKASKKRGCFDWEATFTK